MSGCTDAIMILTDDDDDDDTADADGMVDADVGTVMMFV